MSGLIGSFDSVVMAAVAVDLEAFAGARVQRVRQPNEQEIALDLRASSKRGTLLCSIHPRWARVHLIPAIQGGPELQPFGKMLRSRLAGAQLREVEQPLFERMLRIRFEGDSGFMDLIAEIMGRHSNLIVVQDGAVAGALKTVPRSKSSVREVLPGIPYTAPPHDRPTPIELTRPNLEQLLSLSAAPLGKTLATTLLGLSPTMAAEVAVRAGCDPEAPPSSQERTIDRLWGALQDLVRIVRSRDFSPVLYVDGGHIRGYAPFALESVKGIRPLPVSTMSEAVHRATSMLGALDELETRRSALVGAIRAPLAKSMRTETDLRRALEEAEQSEAARQRGELLLAYASQIPAGASSATLPGYDGSPLVISLDPALTPVENARKLFRRYTKIRKARPALEDRLKTVAEDRAYLESALIMTQQAASEDDLEDLRLELIAEGYLRGRARKIPAKPPETFPRTFTLDRGATVIAGRSNQENDRITFKVARPDDLWFHARGVPGAHVVLRTQGRTPTTDEIKRAASIAAWFSKARESSNVTVAYTPRRNVRKPKGSRPGLVVVEQERTVQVRPGLP